MVSRVSLYNDVDTTSFSNKDEAITTNLHLDWQLDFDKRTISGHVLHSVKIIKAGVEIVHFDSRDLNIGKCTVDGSEVQVIAHPKHKHLGTKLSVPIPAKTKAGQLVKIMIYYSTSPEASAVQWTDAEGTADKKHPYVYTQCQAIHARSLMPCMDSPGIKSTYTATVVAPEWCTVLMSALSQRSVHDSKTTHKWIQPVPTPAYLVALVGGCLESRDISKRVKIWSEPSMVDAAAADFSQTEDFLTAAESFTCEYVWTRYDVLCLPPSFPYGGMENPCLTFVTPTLLSGDKSLADVIAHEIAHSWTGNLVTNSTWNHFFLNEGWTMWLQRKVEQKVKGGLKHLKLSAQVGWTHLEETVEQFGAKHPATSLVCPLGDEDPDEYFSSIPYEKGFHMLYMLETIVGSDNFEAFAKAYIGKFQFGTVTAGTFRDFFKSYCKDKMTLSAAQTSKIDLLDWDNIFYDVGMPTWEPDFSNELGTASAQLVLKWRQYTVGSGFEPKKSDIAGWTVQQVLLLLDGMVSFVKERKKPLREKHLLAMDKAYDFTASNNCEIKFNWLMLCLICEMSWILLEAQRFMITYGRMKYARPLYRAMGASKIGYKLARQTFAEHKMIYHPIARKMIASDLEASSQSASYLVKLTKGLVMSVGMAGLMFGAAFYQIKLD